MLADRLDIPSATDGPHHYRFSNPISLKIKSASLFDACSKSRVSSPSAAHAHHLPSDKGRMRSHTSICDFSISLQNRCTQKGEVQVTHHPIAFSSIPPGCNWRCLEGLGPRESCPLSRAKQSVAHDASELHPDIPIEQDHNNFHRSQTCPARSSGTLEAPQHRHIIAPGCLPFSVAPFWAVFSNV